MSQQKHTDSGQLILAKRARVCDFCHIPEEFLVAVDGNNGEVGQIVLNYRAIELVDETMCLPIKAKNGKTAVICL